MHGLVLAPSPGARAVRDHSMGEQIAIDSGNALFKHLAAKCNPLAATVKESKAGRKLGVDPQPGADALLRWLLRSLGRATGLA